MFVSLAAPTGTGAVFTGAAFVLEKDENDCEMMRNAGLSETSD